MKLNYSVVSLVLVGTVITVLLAAVGLLRTVWKQQRSETELRQKISSLEKTLIDVRTRQKAEFAGTHPPPVLLIDPNVEKASPWLFRIRPSEHRGLGGRYSVEPPGERSSKLRETDFEIRLLRSIDGIDFFRLLYSADGLPAQELLFGYEGKPQLLSASKSLTFVIAPDERAAIDVAVDVRDPAERASLADAWTTGDYRPRVQNANLRIKPLRK